jgi:hypothetical protein
MIDEDECGGIGGMMKGKGNRSNRRKLSQLPLCPLQITNDLTWDVILAAAVGSRQLMNSRCNMSGIYKTQENSSRTSAGEILAVLPYKSKMR